ncbi:MAG: DHHA1 domain-containing protein, partial [candidate division Zixibacteria bacterium]|nr:DHHA1 domain-containing protein [candidate division Zixibacteria bacterium]
GVASGVRRIEAITGREATKYMLDAKKFKKYVASVLNRQENDNLIETIDNIRENNLTLQKEIKKIKAGMFSGNQAKTVGKFEQVGDITIGFHSFGETDKDTMAGWIDTQKEHRDAMVAFALGTIDNKLTYMATASPMATKQHKIHIGNISKELLSHFGGRGGGKPNFAQGSVALDTQPEKFYIKARTIIEKEGKN